MLYAICGPNGTPVTGGQYIEARDIREGYTLNTNEIIWPDPAVWPDPYNPEYALPSCPAWDASTSPPSVVSNPSLYTSDGMSPLPVS